MSSSITHARRLVAVSLLGGVALLAGACGSSENTGSSPGGSGGTVAGATGAGSSGGSGASGHRAGLSGALELFPRAGVVAESAASGRRGAASDRRVVRAGRFAWLMARGLGVVIVVGEPQEPVAWLEVALVGRAPRVPAASPDRPAKAESLVVPA